MLNYTTLQHILKWYLVSKLKCLNPKENTNNLSKKHVQKFCNRGKKPPQKTSIHQSYKAVPSHFILLSAVPQSWFPGAQQAAVRCHQFSSKNAIMVDVKVENIPLTIFLRTYTPIASTLPACQRSPIAFIVFIP